MSVQGPQPWAGPYSAFVGVGGIRGENAPLLAVASRGAGQQLSAAGQVSENCCGCEAGRNYGPRTRKSEQSQWS